MNQKDRRTRASRLINGRIKEVRLQARVFFPPFCHYYIRGRVVASDYETGRGNCYSNLLNPAASVHDAQQAPYGT